MQWLNEVIFGQGNAEQCLHHPRYGQFRQQQPPPQPPVAPGQSPPKAPADEPLRMDYSLVPHLMNAWKNPIKVTPVRKQSGKQDV